MTTVVIIQGAVSATASVADTSYWPLFGLADEEIRHLKMPDFMTGFYLDDDKVFRNWAPLRRAQLLPTSCIRPPRWPKRVGAQEGFV